MVRGPISVCLYTSSRVIRIRAARVVEAERILGEEGAVIERRHKGGENIGNAIAALRTRGQRCSIRSVWHESPCSKNGPNPVRTSKSPNRRPHGEGRSQPGEQMSSSPAFDQLLARWRIYRQPLPIADQVALPYCVHVIKLIQVGVVVIISRHSSLSVPVLNSPFRIPVLLLRAPAFTPDAAFRLSRTSSSSLSLSSPSPRPSCSSSSGFALVASVIGPLVRAPTHQPFPGVRPSTTYPSA